MNFQELENKVYEMARKIACEITASILEKMDEELMKARDKKRYRHNQILKTTVKTVYGDVEYSRRYYQDKVTGEMVFLLDQELQIENNTGLFSAGVKKMVADACINMSYGTAASMLSDYLGRYISKTSCWNIVQDLGSRTTVEINSLEEADKEHTKVLFTETDGVYLKHQRPDKTKGKKLEVKLITVYEGWQKEHPSRLAKKAVYGGIYNAPKFRKNAESFIEGLYDIDDIELKIMNGDGAGWIDDMSLDQVYQLDRFHVKKAITTGIKDKEIRNNILAALDDKNVNQMLHIIELYINSIEGQEKKKVKDAKECFKYLNNHKEHILRYNERESVKVPVPVSSDIIYKNMGVQEGQNYLLVASRMKHRRMRWSRSGANNLVSLICAKENNILNKVIKSSAGSCFQPVIDTDDITVRIQKVVGKNKYYDYFNVSLPAMTSSDSSLVAALRGLSGSL
ncbi:MAG: ISLre2 family transposase [Eubacterium sp.]|nr:ISLre2 family transposase [Eubacterium sp.]